MIVMFRGRQGGWGGWRGLSSGKGADEFGGSRGVE